MFEKPDYLLPFQQVKKIFNVFLENFRTTVYDPEEKLLVNLWSLQ